MSEAKCAVVAIKHDTDMATLTKASISGAIELFQCKAGDCPKKSSLALSSPPVPAPQHTAYVIVFKDKHDATAWTDGPGQAFDVVYLLPSAG